MVCMLHEQVRPNVHVARPRRVICDPGQTSRGLLDLEPDTLYAISLRARTAAGLGPIITAEDRTLEMSGTSRRCLRNQKWIETFISYFRRGRDRPSICNLKKYGWLEKIRLIFELAELSRKKNSAEIRLIINSFGWAIELKWLSTSVMYLLLSVSLMLRNLRPSVITRSFEITRMFHFK